MTQEEFVELCANGTYDEVVKAIESGINPSEPAYFGEKKHMMLPIVAAVLSENFASVDAITDYCEDCGDGFTAAAASNNPKFLRILYEAGCDINDFDFTGHNALMTAAASNNFYILEQCINFGADVNIMTEDGRNALSYAAMFSATEKDKRFNPEIVRRLMEEGSYYTDAMMTAIDSDDSEFAQKLIDEGADVNLVDEAGRSFVMYSVMTGGGILRTLLANGADPNIPDRNGRTPLMIAAIDEELGDGVIDTLLEFGADIDARDNKGLTALMWSAASVDKAPNLMMPALIRTGGFSAEGWEKWCEFIALYTAVRHELQLEIVRYLVMRGADVNKMDKRGMTALMYAIANDDKESAEILSAAGAQINFDII